MKRIPVIGLVGGIGSGKSSVARGLAAHANLCIVNGDEAGHAVLRQDGVKAAIRARFGDAVFDSTGEVNRRDMGRAVFGSEPERQSARQALEQIVHPAIGQLLQEQIRKAQQEGVCEAVLLDAAILLETGWRQYCDAVVFVDVPETQRLERVKKTRGWTSGEFFARESSQLPVQSKRGQSDYVVDNSGPLESAITQLKQICTQIKDDLPQL